MKHQACQLGAGERLFSAGGTAAGRIGADAPRGRSRKRSVGGTAKPGIFTRFGARWAEKQAAIQIDTRSPHLRKGGLEPLLLLHPYGVRGPNISAQKLFEQAPLPKKSHLRPLHP
ncbi:hypothetical protein F2981_24475 (plasmid) [Sinorhizobium meliloti]|nr:hypothetical protein [Sinorhizobium meliloti]